MTSLCPGIGRRQPEDGQDGLIERIAEGDREVESGVVAASLGALHPVHNTAAGRIGMARSNHLDPGMWPEQMSERRQDIGPVAIKD